MGHCGLFARHGGMEADLRFEKGRTRTRESFGVWRGEERMRGPMVEEIGVGRGAGDPRELELDDRGSGR